MNILALEPFYGGSHRAFIDGWMAHSRHAFSLLTLPDSHWKWRMRHAAVAFAESIQRRAAQGETWDLIWASDMLNLAELRGLLPGAAGRLPAILYFHENQLTYPVREQRQRDLHFAFTNFISCSAADAIWFNSRFHLTELLPAFDRLLAAMPDRQPRHLLSSMEARASVQSPGVDIARRAEQDRGEPLRIVWAARWEHDKNAADFFAALELLERRGRDFRLAVVGEQFRETPPEFAAARRRFAGRIDYWGFQATRADYLRVLHWADCFVSTARHEFFGITAVEAIAAGCLPLLPWRLAYPELLDAACQADAPFPADSPFFYQGSVADLADKLDSAIRLLDNAGTWIQRIRTAQSAVQRFHWRQRATAMDEAAEQVVDSGVR
ncbi:MAG: DUF3524 domain-containing protein [Pirellulales bacterium]